MQLVNRTVSFSQKRGDGPTQRSESSDELEHDRLPLPTAGLHQDGEVANLVGNLVKEDRDGGEVTDRVAAEKRRPDGQPVGEVVSEVGGQVQVRGYLDVLRRYRSF